MITGYFDRPKHLKYEDYFASELRARYMALEAEFRTYYPDYLVGDLDEEERDDLPYLLTISEYIVYLLNLSREVLERKKLDKRTLLTATNLLDLAEECLVWIIPFEQVGTKIPALVSRINGANPGNAEDYRLKLKRLEESIGGPIKHKERLMQLINEKNDAESLLQKVTGRIDAPEKGDDKVELEEKRERLSKRLQECSNGIRDESQAIDNFKDGYRSLFDEIIWACNQKLLENIVNVGLQIERLCSFRKWGMIFFLVFFAFSPIFLNVGKFSQAGFVFISANFPFFQQEIFKAAFTFLQAYYIAIGLAVLGGAGGFLSGLLQVRSSRTTLALYEESVILLQLRPMFGAFAALILSMLLSWGALQGILSNNMGSYILVAFTSGFSERYFLKLLKIETDLNQPEDGNGDAATRGQTKEDRPPKETL